MKNSTLIHQLQKRVAPLIAAVCLVVSLVPSSAVFAAGTNKLYLSPSTLQMNPNVSFHVDVLSFTNSDQTVGTARGSVTYPTNILQVTGTSVSGSVYGSPTITTGAGAITFNGSRDPAPGGIGQKIFTITFKAIGAGTANVGFSSDSYVNNTTTAYVSGIYTVTNSSGGGPAPSPSTKPKPQTSPLPSSSSPSTDSSSSTDDNPQPTPDPTGLIGTVNVNPLYDSATVNWKVNATNPNISFAYGVSNTQLDKSAQVKKESDGSYSTSISSLTPGQRYYFSITAKAPDGTNGTYSGIIITRGFPVTLTLTENKVAIQAGQVKIGSQLYLVGSTGKVTVGLAAGGYSGTINTDTSSLAITLTVISKTIPTDGSAPETQNFAFNLTSSALSQGPGAGTSIIGFVGILIGGTVILALGVVGFIVYRRRRFEGSDDPVTTYRNESPGVIIDDGYKWQPPDTPDPSAPQAGPPLTPNPPPPQPSGTEHHNSVYLPEAEPMDMFEQAEKDRQLSATQHPVPQSGPSGTEQNSSSPHSTTP